MSGRSPRRAVSIVDCVLSCSELFASRGRAQQRLATASRPSAGRIRRLDGGGNGDNPLEFIARVQYFYCRLSGGENLQN